MPDFEAPERDAIEQEEPADDAAELVEGDEVGADLEAPEADAVEQRTPVRTNAGGAATADRPIEADEADAADQAHAVEFDEDEYR